MRHGKKFNHLGRTASHRSAMLSNMASSLIIHKCIVTTVAKAKALRLFVEPIITRSKEASTHNYRTAFSYLKDKVAVNELFTVVGGKVANRPGGYTRILKTGNRAGDNAEMAMIELVDFNEFFEGFSVDRKKSTTRRSRRGGAVKSTTVKAETAVEAVVEEIVTESIVVEEVKAETAFEAVVEEIVTESIVVEETIDTAPEVEAIEIVDAESTSEEQFPEADTSSEEETK